MICNPEYNNPYSIPKKIVILQPQKNNKSNNEN